MLSILVHKTVHILVSGLVQGVGFRPFIYRIAIRHELLGWVQNTNENVKIMVTGTPENINQFLISLKEEVPPAAMIEEIAVKEVEPAFYPEFSILSSHNLSDEITEISPDIAVCDACLEDMDKPGFRLDYAFVNCTNCGPRFTIISDLPYDRSQTTMSPFEMCPDCRKEYETVTDRRFHAQPTACNLCGPHYQLFANNIELNADIDQLILQVSQTLDKGGIVLMKGLGGMHLACDAFNEGSVARLRELKNREGKPFAILFRDLETLYEYAEISEIEKQSLLSWRRPIVLLNKKKKTPSPELAQNLNAGLNLIGVMLPYLPIHHLLFRKLKTHAIVLTSGNFSSEPILIDNQIALKDFSPLVDAIVLHNRDIFNRTDDSVVRVIGEKERVFRRSRGYAPSPVRTALNTEGIVAFGAELTNCFCSGKGHKAFLSQHIGDLQNLETALFYESTIARLLKLFRIRPSLLAVDMHPSYVSTRTGSEFGDFPLVRVQHHHAHIASCMAENKLDEKVLGIALDGTGYGPDGNIWGSEFLICDLNDYTRELHFEYVPLPGGDMAVEEPWRMAISYLYKVFGREFTEIDIPAIKMMDTEKTGLIIQMIEKKINCPLTSGAGRLFDCVASLLNLVQVASFQAEGPMRLESLVNKNCQESYAFTMATTINFDLMIRGIIEDLKQNLENTLIATKFHNTIIKAAWQGAEILRKKHSINKVVLSGGVFQNKYILEGLAGLLEKNKFEVFSHVAIPANDGGIALGQLAIASKRRELKCV